MGYGNILYNLARYDQALKAYLKVIKLRPTLTNAYVAIMLLHEFRRIEKSKSLSYAKKVL
jgi:tetratricopeptide (TPR) repeat protein